MCIEDRLKGKKKKDFIASLPEVFPVWKFVAENHTEYWQLSEPKFNKAGIYKAGHYNEERSFVNYKPGYHAMFKKPKWKLISQVLGIRHRVCLWARRKWVKEVGNAGRTYGEGPCLVLSHIEVRALPEHQIARTYHLR